jgi:hypothetical protein
MNRLTERINMAKKAKRRKLVRWTKAELKELRGHSRSKASVAKISKAMKRTPGSLRQKAASLGVPLGHQR